MRIPVLVSVPIMFSDRKIRNARPLAMDDSQYCQHGLFGRENMLTFINWAAMNDKPDSYRRLVDLVGLAESERRSWNPKQRHPFAARANGSILARNGGVWDILQPLVYLQCLLGWRHQVAGVRTYVRQIDNGHMFALQRRDEGSFPSSSLIKIIWG